MKEDYDLLSDKAQYFINPKEVAETIAYGKKYCNDAGAVVNILAKAREKNGLTHREAAVLLLNGSDWVTGEIAKLAREIKNAYYGNRVVLFAPLYLSNYCVNGCTYCPYHSQNRHIFRKKMTQEEIKAEVIALQDMGHKRLALEAGEDPVHNPLEYILESIDTIYGIKHKAGVIRRVNVNIAATTVEDYRKLHAAKIGTYILFQETYNREDYEKLHPRGPKSDYVWHTEAMDRAMKAGIEDVGLGVLFGLHNYVPEFISLLMHAEHLEAVYGAGPHTISVPRICPADGISLTNFRNALPNGMFLKIIALLRIAVPYTGMIISTRERAAIREEALSLGISQISGGSKTSVGGYAAHKEPEPDSAQFEISDNRSLDEVVRWLMELGYVPSFCTSCYGKGRVGEDFMAICKKQQIHNYCTPNALLTLKEYLDNYATFKTKRIGNALIGAELQVLPKSVKTFLQCRMKELKRGELRFF